MLYVVSDTHLDEFPIIDQFYSIDFFMCADAYMSYVMRRWNDKIKDEDTVIIVGDAGDPARMKELTGHKILVRGNHDDYDEKLYNVYDKVVDYIYLEESGIKIIFEHILGSTDIDADIRICGHSHNAECYRYNGEHTLVYVLINLLGYEPRTLKELFDTKFHNWPFELFKLREAIISGEYDENRIKW